MVDRTLSANVVTESEAGEYRTVGFVLLDFDSDPVYAWTGTRTLTIALPGEGSHAYLGIGLLGSIDGILETSDRSVNGVTLQMSGVGNDLLANALGQDYQGRDAKIWIAFLDSDEVVVVDPLLLFHGQMDVMSLVDGDGTGVIQVQCESADAILDRTSESLYTDEEQQRVYSGDLGLEFVLPLQTLVLTWGEKGMATDRIDRELPGWNRR